MGKNNKLIDSVVKMAKRNRELNIDTAVKRQTPIFCAAACLALNKMAPGTDAETMKEFLIEMQNAIDEHPHDILKTCKNETGVIIKMEEDYNGKKRTMAELQDNSGPRKGDREKER